MFSSCLRIPGVDFGANSSSQQLALLLSVCAKFAYVGRQAYFRLRDVREAISRGN